jgi:hypothetical protein
MDEDEDEDEDEAYGNFLRRHGFVFVHTRALGSPLVEAAIIVRTFT